MTTKSVVSIGRSMIGAHHAKGRARAFSKAIEQRTKRTIDIRERRAVRFDRVCPSRLFGLHVKIIRLVERRDVDEQEEPPVVLYTCLIQNTHRDRNLILGRTR